MVEPWPAFRAALWYRDRPLLVARAHESWGEI